MRRQLLSYPELIYFHSQFFDSRKCWKSHVNIYVSNQLVEWIDLFLISFNILEKPPIRNSITRKRLDPCAAISAVKSAKESTTNRTRLTKKIDAR